jgi:hypothetical protein
VKSPGPTLSRDVFAREEALNSGDILLSCSGRMNGPIAGGLRDWITAVGRAVWRSGGPEDGNCSAISPRNNGRPNTNY